MEKSKDLFQPGVAIEITDVAELASFEDMVARAVVPDATETQWARWEGRIALKNTIRPPKFNGTITNIEITPLENSYESLYSAIEKGWKGGQLRTVIGNSYKLSEENHRLRKDSCLGFSLVADAKSTGRGKIGEIQMALWYMESRTFNLARTTPQSPRPNLGGTAVYRVLSDPEIETDNFIRLNEESSRIAFSVIRSAMKHPLRIGMHN